MTTANQLSDDERAQLERGLCTWQVDSGTPWTKYCGAKATHGTFCAEHDRDRRELYPTPARTEVTFNYEGGDCTLAEFLESNLETLSRAEILKVARLSVGEVALIPVHCGFAQIVRTQ